MNINPMLRQKELELNQVELGIEQLKVKREAAREKTKELNKKIHTFYQGFISKINLKISEQFPLIGPCLSIDTILDDESLFIQTEKGKFLVKEINGTLQITPL